jgi:hypothetical protein
MLEMLLQHLWLVLLPKPRYNISHIVPCLGQGLASSQECLDYLFYLKGVCDMLLYLDGN